MMKEEMDILREVGTTAAAHASTALSSVLGEKINIYLPEVEIVSVDEVKNKIHSKDVQCIIENKILSGLDGKVIFILQEKDAYKFINMCYTMKGEISKGAVTEISISLLKEIDNIIVSSYSSSLGKLLNRIIIPSLPVFINAPFDRALELLLRDYDNQKYVMSITTVFEQMELDIKGCFWILLTQASVDDIRQACLNMINGIKNCK